MLDLINQSSLLSFQQAHIGDNSTIIGKRYKCSWLQIPLDLLTILRFSLKKKICTGKSKRVWSGGHFIVLYLVPQPKGDFSQIFWKELSFLAMCFEFYVDSCCVADEGLLGADLSLSSCVVDLSRGPCRDGVCSRALIHFSPTTDFVKDGNRTTQISVKPFFTQNFLWNGYSPEPVEVNRSTCPGWIKGGSLLIHNISISVY